VAEPEAAGLAETELEGLEEGVGCPEALSELQAVRPMAAAQSRAASPAEVARRERRAREITRCTLPDLAM
jgi:hypothetical protein